ncbi:Ig-like domain-containing protein, partial [Enterobacter sp. IF2SW-P2]|uniref:Ig-like domain-containing protein n=1 Tax=Enterobacter sp. IF2SW-P2 TaxID=1841144 RepID=UPI003521CD35
MTVKDAHENPVAGQVVNFRAGEGVILPATATTEKDGTVTVSQTSLKAGELLVNATSGDNWSHANSVQVTFAPGISTPPLSFAVTVSVTGSSTRAVDAIVSSTLPATGGRAIEEESSTLFS